MKDSGCNAKSHRSVGAQRPGDEFGTGDVTHPKRSVQQASVHHCGTHFFFGAIS